MPGGLEFGEGGSEVAIGSVVGRVEIGDPGIEELGLGPARAVDVDTPRHGMAINRIPAEGDSGAASPRRVAKDHEVGDRSGAEVIDDATSTSVPAGGTAIPRLEYRLDGLACLLFERERDGDVATPQR